jgi:hypothetical protein
MVYVFGTIGFIGGFMAGQMLLYFMLRHKSREEITQDSSIKWTYGLLNWAVAILGAFACVEFYYEYLKLSGG